MTRFISVVSGSGIPSIKDCNAIKFTAAKRLKDALNK